MHAFACARPWPTTWKWCEPFWRRAPHPTSTRWVSRRSWLRPALEPATAEEPALLRSRAPVDAANMALMDLLLQHGADVNAQVTGTQDLFHAHLPRALSERRHDGSPRSGAGGPGRSGALPARKGANPELVDSQRPQADRFVERRWGRPGSSGASRSNRQHCRSFDSASRGNTCCWGRRSRRGRCASCRSRKWSRRSRRPPRWSRQPGNRGRDSRPIAEPGLQEIIWCSPGSSSGPPRPDRPAA